MAFPCKSETLITEHLPFGVANFRLEFVLLSNKKELEKTHLDQSRLIHKFKLVAVIRICSPNGQHELAIIARFSLQKYRPHALKVAFHRDSPPCRVGTSSAANP